MYIKYKYVSLSDKWTDRYDKVQLYPLMNVMNIHSYDCFHVEVVNESMNDRDKFWLLLVVF